MLPEKNLNQVPLYVLLHTISYCDLHINSQTVRILLRGLYLDPDFFSMALRNLIHKLIVPSTGHGLGIFQLPSTRLALLKLSE